MDKPQATCPGCSTPLAADHHGNRAYCGERCRKRLEKQRRAERERTGSNVQAVCAQCGATFTIADMRGGRRYCSEECRRARDTERSTSRLTCAMDGCDKLLTVQNHSGYCRHHFPQARFGKDDAPRACAECNGPVSGRQRRICDSCLACVDCGTPVLHARWGSDRRCPDCLRRHRAILELGKALVRLRQSFAAQERIARRQAAQEAARQERDCAHCGLPFTSVRLTQKYCCYEHKRSAVSLNAKVRRRTRKTDAYREDVWRKVVVERDGWRCGICRKRIDPKLKHPHLMSLSLDHIIPLAKGGTHEYSNVQAAHLLCNSIKGATGASQLLLFG